MKVHICGGPIYQVWTKHKWHANFISLITSISLSQIASWTCEAWPRPMHSYSCCFKVSSSSPSLTDDTLTDCIALWVSHWALTLALVKAAIYDLFSRARISRHGGFGEVRSVRTTSLPRALCSIKLQILLWRSNTKSLQFRKRHDSCKLLLPFSLIWHSVQVWNLYNNIGGSQGELNVLCHYLLLIKILWTVVCFGVMRVSSTLSSFVFSHSLVFFLCYV